MKKTITINKPNNSRASYFFIICKPYNDSYVLILSFQPRPTKGKMRIHCLENVDKALTFLHEQRVHLENMGAHDIVDGSSRLTLGLIWTIILRFQVSIENHTQHLHLDVLNMEQSFAYVNHAQIRSWNQPVLSN